jgi:hypothetical protein
VKKLLIVVAVVVLGWFANQRAHRLQTTETVDMPASPSLSPVAQTSNVERPGFHCDGRTLCSQMSSCEEATFFLRNCPDVKMDGDGDGIPCEQQFCGH